MSFPIEAFTFLALTAISRQPAVRLPGIRQNSVELLIFVITQGSGPSVLTLASTILDRLARPNDDRVTSLLP